MKILTKLEKNKATWWLIALCTLFFLLRLPSIIEPYWYGDEGIYQVIGQALNQGHLLYRDIWDNKPPLLYLIYALVNGDQASVRVLSLLAGVLSVGFFFYLTKKVFTSLRITIGLTFLYVLLFATPVIEGNIANAENFILLPIIAAGLLVYNSSLRGGATKQSSSGSQSSRGLPRSFFARNDKTMKLLTAGLLLGIAFLFKIVAIFDFAAFFLFLFFTQLQKIDRKNLKSAFQNLLLFLSGFLFPILIAFIFFAIQGTIAEFIQAAFFGNIMYVGWKNTFLGIPQGLLFLKIFLLLGTVSVIFLKRNSLSHTVLFITLWTAFSLFNTLFSGRLYPHYLLVMLPTYCFLLGLLFASKTKVVRYGLFASIVAGSVLLQSLFQLNFAKTFAYYPNTFQFLTDKKNLIFYQTFFDARVPRDYAIVSFINSRTKPEDNVFIWGNSPQIYALSNKLPPNKYTVAYHIIPNNAAMDETQQAINWIKPRYIIVLSEDQPLPFSVPLYIMRFTMEGATIYERSF